MIKEKTKLAVIVLGKPNSGKSSTWYGLFGRVIRSGAKYLVIGDTELEVNVKNASFEEYGDEAEDYFDDLPDVVFCSVQYTEKGLRTINWFKENGYYLYIQWLNPGYYYDKQYPDFLEFESQFKSYGLFTCHSGKEVNLRAAEIVQFLEKWTSE